MQPQHLPPELTSGELGTAAVVLRGEANSLLERNRSVVIHDDADYDVVCRELVRVASLRKSITAAFADAKRRAYEAHKAIAKLEADLLAIPGQVESLIKRAIGTYQAEAERKRREEQARLSEIAKRDEEDRRIADAEQLSAAGHHAEADALLSEPILAPVVHIDAPKADGVSMRRKWTFRIVDLAAIKADFLIPDEKKIRQLVTALGPDAVKVVGGIVVEEEQIVAVRT
jgi:hypothetical protein